MFQCSRPKGFVLAALLAWGGGSIAAAQNLLANPDFDHGVDGWSATEGSLSWLAAVDLDDCAGSGAARLSDPTVVGAEEWLELEGPCADVAPGEEYAAVIRMNFVVSPAHTDISLRTYTDDGCGAGESEQGIVGYNALATGIWFDFMIGTTIGPGVESARPLVRLRDPSSTAFEARFDRMYMGQAMPLLLDDFEAGSICRF